MHSVFVVLPIVNYCVWARLLRCRYTDSREVLMVSSVWWVLCLVALTELLSIPTLLTQPALAAGWCLLTIMVLVADSRLKRQLPLANRSAMNQPERLGRLDWFLIAGAAVICALVAITALISPPNGADALANHLPRVVQWAQRHSVEFFPTHYYVQLFSPPLAEWMILHSYVLYGGDRFVNLIQWFGMVGSAIGVSLIARELGGLQWARNFRLGGSIFG